MIGINNKAIHNILCGLYLSAYTHIYVQYIQQVNLLVKMCMSAVECTLTNDILMQGALSVSFEQNCGMNSIINCVEDRKISLFI